LAGYSLLQLAATEATKSHSTFQIFNYYHRRDDVRNFEVDAKVL
jgi:hypothetical protein